MAWTSSKTGQDEKSLPAVVNQGYFSDYFLAYRLDANPPQDLDCVGLGGHSMHFAPMRR